MFISNCWVLLPGEDPSFPLHGINEPTLEKVVVREKAPIVLRDYQQEAYEACIRDLESGKRSSLIVLATGLGKTILFSKIIENWPGRVLVLVHLEELLQNAVQEIGQITGEAIGVQRGSESHEGERVVVGTVQTVSLRLRHFDPNHFSLIIVDEAHHAAAKNYGRVFEHFFGARVVGLTATDQRADGKALPFAACSYRLGIREGIDKGYLVPIRGKRIVIESIDLSHVKVTESGDFDAEALDDEMVKGCAAIADVICNDYSFDKGILFFPGCLSAKLTCEFINRKMEGNSVYIDGKITGQERRSLVSKLRSGESNWLCNVGIATEGFNWPEATVVGMCTPTLSRAAYVQRVGRGTRPLAGLLNGLLSEERRKAAILNSTKPYMTILDFVGVSASLSLITHESFLQESLPTQMSESTDSTNENNGDSATGPEDKQEEVGVKNDEILAARSNLKSLAKSIDSRTEHSVEEFCPFEATDDFEPGRVELKKSVIGKEELASEKQLKLLGRYGIEDPMLTIGQATKLIGFIAQRNFRLTIAEKGILKRNYELGKRESKETAP